MNDTGPPPPEDITRLVAGMPVAMAINTLDDPARVVFLNTMFEVVYGYRLDDISDTRAWWPLAYPDPAYRAYVRSAWDDAVLRARTIEGLVETMEFRVTAKDGTIHDTRFGAVVVGNHLVVTLTDVTDLRRVERELRSARVQLDRAAYDLTANIPVGTYVLERSPDEQPRFTFVSTRWLEMLDLDREAVLADPARAFDCVHPEEREAFLRLNNEVVTNQEPFSWEGRIVVRGETRWVTIESIPRARPGGGTIWEGVMIDVTERTLTARALAAAREREKHAEEEARVLLEQKLRTSLSAAAVVHEINLPLSNVLLGSKLAVDALDRIGTAADPLRPLLAGLVAESERVVDTMETMRMLLRNVQTELVPIDLGTVVHNAVLYAGHVLDGHGVELVTESCDGAWPVFGDAIQLQGAIVNLLRNAAEAAAANSDRPPRVLIGLRMADDDGRTAEVVVGDSGPGLPPHLVVGTPLTSTKPKGSGLGLFVVQTTVENHRGRLDTGTSPLGGAEFRLLLPLVPDGT